MAGALNQTFGIHVGHAKGGQRLGAAAFVGLRQLRGLSHQAHAAPAAAGHGLEHHAGLWVARALLGKEGFDGGQVGRGRAGQQRHAVRGGQCAGLRLVAKQRQLRGRGADEAEAGIGTRLRKVGALAQEAVARVHRIAAQRLRGGHDGGDVQVGGRAGGGQRHGLVGQRGVQCARVVLREHGHGGDAEVLCRADHAHGDLPAVGNEQLLEHQAWSFSRRRSTLPAPVAGNASMKRTLRGAL